MAVLISACTDGWTDSETDRDSDTEEGTAPDTDVDPDTWGPCGVDSPSNCRVEDGVCVMPVPSGMEPTASAVMTPEDYGAAISSDHAGLSPTGTGGALLCPDGVHFATISANSAAIILPGQYPQQVSALASLSGEPSSVSLTVRNIETGTFTGVILWDGDEFFSPECDYWWFGSGEADSCIDVALDLIRPLLLLCPESNAGLPRPAGCPCVFNLVTDDINPLCEDTNGDGYWETPTTSR